MSGKEALRQEICDAVSTILGIPTNPDETYVRGETAEWDSLRHIEIVFALEEKFDIEFSETELAELDNLEKLIDAVVVKHGA